MNNNKNSWFKRSSLLALVLLFSVSLSGCSWMFDWVAKRHASVVSDTLVLPGLQAPVQVARDEYGVPLIEAESLHDLTYAIGYVMAQDRLAQMVSMNLLARGRLSEMAGEVAIDLDVYMRTLGVPQIIDERYLALSDDMKGYLTQFSAGVNAFIEQHRGHLPLELVLNDYQPEAWQPHNTIGLFVLLNLGVGFNLHEELAFLQLAGQLGWEKAAWLAPIYPDEAIDFAEAAKLADVDLSRVQADVQAWQQVAEKMKHLTGQGIAASNNWGVQASHTANQATIIANDTHLLLSQPSTWTLMQVQSPEYSGVGITLPGIPALVAGYNGHIAWGETMVMADTQDVFLEQLRERDGVTEYLYQDAWYPVAERTEVIRVKGQPDRELTVQTTRHGPLLNSALLASNKHPIVPPETASRFGLALSWTATYPDNTIDAFFQLGQAKTMDEAERVLNEVGFIHLNVIYGTATEMAWQVTGQYPRRAKGSGHFPSPGWTGEYEWQGVWGGESLPRERNPQQGWLGTGNHRTVAADYTPTLTSSWYYPERYERLAQMLASRDDHDLAFMQAMQADRVDLFVAKAQQALFADTDALTASMAALSEQERSWALTTLAVLQAFDGHMAEDSRAAAVWGAFEHHLIRAIFLDELGPDDGALWTQLMALNGRAYSAYQDHILRGADAPFWNDVTTENQEGVADIVVRALQTTWPYLQRRLGTDDQVWQWGQLLTYHWQTETTHLRPHIPGIKGHVVDALARYTDRGPYPAGGNRNTLNVAGHDLGKDYRVWNIPAMRLIVDFSQDEPLQLVVAGGQSGNPASPHYDDGIDLWLSMENRTLPFHDAQQRQAHFQPTLQLLPHP
ncbi:MAG: penicillin acylase family protein [Bacterioplanes sp.]|nr:penicillin acylase family protein [Bacterioplanes sp.]